MFLSILHNLMEISLSTLILLAWDGHLLLLVRRVTFSCYPSCWPILNLVF